MNIINVGNIDAKKVEITVSTLHPYLTFSQNKIIAKNLEAGTVLESKTKVKMKLTKYVEELINGTLFFEIKIDGVVADTQKIIFFETPNSPYVSGEDVIVLDGRTVKNVPVFHQGKNKVLNDSLSGGIGNGNGILEKGEEALVFIRLPKGISSADTNSFHKTYLINQSEDKYVKVNKLKYDEKISQAGATSVSSIITFSEDIPKSHQPNLWFRVESLYNDKEDPTAKNTVYANKYDYKKILFKMRLL